MANPRPIHDRDYILFALRLIGEFGAVIAVPIILFVLAGQWVDARIDTGLIFTILGFLLAALLTGRTIVKKAKKYGRIYQEMVNRDYK